MDISVGMTMVMVVTMGVAMLVAVKMANEKGNGNVNECQVTTLYKQHEMKTLTILDLFLSAIILFAVSLISLSLEAILVAWRLDIARMRESLPLST